MYVIETLPLLINLDTQPYIPDATIDLVGVQPVKTLISAVSCPHNAAVPYASWLSTFNSGLNSTAAIVSGSAKAAQFTPALNMVAIWGTLNSLDTRVALPEQSSGLSLDSVSAQCWQKTQPLDHQAGFGNQQAGISLLAGWGFGFSTKLNAQARYLVADSFFVDRVGVRPDEYQLRAGELFTSASGLVAFDESNYIPSANFAWGDYQLEKRRTVPMVGVVSIAAYQPPSRATPAVLPWGVGLSLYHTPQLPYVVEPVNTDPVPAPAADKQEVYIIMNHVDVYSLPDNVPLSVSDISIELDEDSFSWKFGCVVLNQSSIDLMKPAAGAFKEIGVNINGHIWTFFISSWQQAKNISGNDLNKRFQVVGYSRTQYLAEQFAPKRTQSIGNTTAAQAATAELTGTGFVCEWRTTELADWTMPGSIFSYQEMAPLQVIKKLADTVGGIVIPAMSEDKDRKSVV